MIRSTLFQGRVRHARRSPREHSFAYDLHLMYLDLEELPTLFRGRWLWSVDRANLISFRRSDYFGPSEQPLRVAVLDRIERELGRRPAGHVGVLTQVRTLGYLFNPVSFYFCHDEAGELDAVIAEITNTPWGERHAYVLDARACKQRDGRYVFEFEKDFHISPFFPMEQSYTWMFRWEPERVQIAMTNREAGKAVFTAALDGERQPIDGRSLARAILRFPLQPLRLHVAIYWQAARLFFKRIPVFTHPKKSPTLREAPLP